MSGCRELCCRGLIRSLLSGLAGLAAGGLAAGHALAQPANDTCATAESISINPGTAQVVGGDNRTAGNDPGIPACTLSSSGGSGTKGVWYTFVGTGNAVTLDTCGTARDLVLRVFCGPCGSLQCAASDDDGCDVFTTSSPRLSMCTTAGTTYTVLLSRFGGNSGTGIEFLMTVTDSGSPCPASAAPTCSASVRAPNDVCLNATPVAIGSSALASTINATTETGIASTCGVSTANGVWFSFVGNGGNVVASTCSALTGANTRVHIFSGACGNLECVDGSTTTTAPCASRGDAASAAATCTVLGQTYYVLVSNDSNGSGLFELSLTGSPCVPPPVNDKCENALPLPPGSSALVDTTWATTDLVSFIRQGVWYTFTPTTQTRVEFSTCDAATAVDTQINLFFGTCGPADPNGLTVIDGASDADPICDIRPDSAALSACLLPGRTYYLLVGGGQGASAGSIRVTATAAGPCGPANDTCAGADPLVLGVPVDASNFDAADEVGATSCGGVTIPPLNNGIWYRYTHAGPAARVAATTCDTDPDQSNTFFDTAILVYSGTCGALTCVSANDNPLVACDDREDEAYAEFCAQPGQTYYVLLVNGETAFDGGQFRISVVSAAGVCDAPVEGACCAGATCSILTQAACTGPGTRFAGAGTVCNAPGAGTTPCCRADFDQSGVRDVADIFAFLSAWFAASPTADADASGVRDVADIFAFLSQWFAGC